VECNQTYADYSRGAFVHQQVADQAKITPDAPAVRCGTEMLTYAQLNAYVNRVAGRLRELIITRETPVALLLDRSVEFAACILAIWKVGGIYVPIDPEYPLERIRWIIED